MRLLIPQVMVTTVPLHDLDNDGKEYMVSRFNDILFVCKQLTVHTELEISESWIKYTVYQQNVDLGEISMNRLLNEVLTELFDVYIQYIPRGDGCEMTLRISKAVPLNR